MNHDERRRGGERDDGLSGGADGRAVLEQFAAKFQDRDQLSPSVSSKPNATLKF